MEIFSYPPDEASRQEKTRIRFIVIPYSITVVFMLVVVYFTIPGLRLEEYISTGLVVLAIAVAVGYVKIRSAGKSAASVQITINADSIAKTQTGTRTVRISRSQVNHLVQLPGSGIRIDSIIPGDQIFVPKEIENFARIESILSEWHPPTQESSSVSPWVFVILSFMLLSTILVLVPPTHRIGLTLWGLGAVGTMVAQVVQGIRRFFVKRRLGQDRYSASS
jgi:uncharacterized protein (UPF0333 family)